MPQWCLNHVYQGENNTRFPREQLHFDPTKHTDLLSMAVSDNDKKTVAVWRASIGPPEFTGGTDLYFSVSFRVTVNFTLCFRFPCSSYSSSSYYYYDTIHNRWCICSHFTYRCQQSLLYIDCLMRGLQSLCTIPLGRFPCRGNSTETMTHVLPSTRFEQNPSQIHTYERDKLIDKKRKENT